MLQQVAQRMAAMLIQALLLTALTGGKTSFASALGFKFGGPVRKFASGGMVDGGIPGRDSVPALLTPGEFVVPAPIVKMIRNEPNPRGFAAGGMVGGGGGGTVIVNAPMPLSSAPPDSMAVERHFRDSVMPTLNRLNGVGVAPGLQRRVRRV